jgi:hypothetical protein
MSACRMCGCDPCVNPGFCSTCAREERAHPRRESAQILRLRRLLKDDVSLERAYAEINHLPHAASSTVEALAYQLRGGAAVLHDPSVIRRISELDQTQMRNIAERLGKRVPPWELAQIALFVDAWRTVRDQRRN